MKIVVETSGGGVLDVHRMLTGETWNGEWLLLDWDDIESDFKHTWARWPHDLRLFFEHRYPKDFADLDWILQADMLQEDAA